MRNKLNGSSICWPLNNKLLVEKARTQYSSNLEEILTLFKFNHNRLLLCISSPISLFQRPTPKDVKHIAIASSVLPRLLLAVRSSPSRRRRSPVSLSLSLFLARSPCSSLTARILYQCGIECNVLISFDLVLKLLMLCIGFFNSM